MMINDILIYSIWIHTSSKESGLEVNGMTPEGLSRPQIMCIPTWLSEEPLSFNFFGQMRVGKVRRPRLQTTHQMPLSRSWNG